MAKNQLFDLYEKLYFHEIDVREKLSSRLQTPMAIIVSLTGVLGFLIQKFDIHQSSNTSSIFIFLLIVSAISLVCSAYFFIRSWHGNTYAFLPSAEDTENYKKLLEDTYRSYNKGDSLAEGYLNDYLCSYYINCATQNTRCNDLRSINLHKTNKTLIIATLFVSISFIVFFFGGLDKTIIKKPSEIVIVKPIDINGAFFMAEKKPEPPKAIIPPPPPPPPPRQIREGVEIIHPKPENKNGKR